MAEFEIAKGVRDWYGQDAIVRNYVRDTLRKVFEKYGYNPIETPIIERQETLGFKGGGEIQKEVFKLQDQGKRNLALRFDQTVPFARFVACHRDVKMPFKRYVIGEVFRDGPTQPDQGRYRIFTQCDVDVVGVKEMTAEAELLALAQDAFNELGLGNVEVRINNRKLLDGVLEYAGVPEAVRTKTIITLDKADKIGIDGVEKELLEMRDADDGKMLNEDTMQKVISSYRQDPSSLSGMRDRIVADVGNSGYDEILAMSKDLAGERFVEAVVNYTRKGGQVLGLDEVKKLLGVVQQTGSNDATYKLLSELVSSERGKEGLAEVGTLLAYSAKMGLDFVKLDPCLARGLDYYTGTTIEVYLKDREKFKSAILAGGRYDNMVGDFCGDQQIPAVGFSFGLERVVMVMKDLVKGLPSTNTGLYIVPLGNTTDECLRICRELRAKGLNVDMELQGKRKLGASISYAEQAGIPFVGIVGSNEVAENKISLKNLAARTQESLGLDQVVERLKHR
jgi:histidyl-tRNA synthetase